MKKIYLLLFCCLLNFGVFAQANLQNLPQVLFTAPGPVAKGASSPIILDKIIELVNNTPVNDTISLSIYIFNYDPLITALKNADTRGVILRLIIDDSRSDSQTSNASTFTKLASLSSNAQVVKFNSDAGSSSINHTKFVLFSNVSTTTGLQPKVLLQTSHNFTLSDSRKLQDALIFNHVGLYNSFWKYFNNIILRSPTGMAAYAYSEYNDAAAGIKACFLPRRGSGQPDNIIEILNSITNLPTAVIKVGMSDWVASRLNVAQKLTQLSAAGARVEVVVKNKIDPEIQTELAKLKNTGGYLKMYNLVNDDDPTINIHAKFMVIEGTYQGIANSQVVVTGSHNFTTNALRYNNEILMVLNNSPLFAAYKAYFDNIKYIDPPTSIAKWNFRSMAGNESTVAAVSTSTGITTDGLTRGGGFNVTSSSLANGFTSAVTAFTTSSITKARANNEFFQFAVNVGLTGNNVLSLYTIDARLRRSSNGNNNYLWAYSLDGSNYTDISSSANTITDSDDNGIFRPTVDLRSIPELQALAGGSKIYFRLYAWGSTTAGGSFALGRSANATEATLEVSGLAYNVLPVVLNLFMVKKETDYVKVNWQTQSEKNNSSFSLQRAQGDQKYSEIYQVAGQGNKESITSYQFLDKTPMLGANYYILKQTDYNGDTVTFGPMAINFNLNAKNGLTATAVTNGLHAFVDYDKNVNANLNIYNVSGSLIISKKVQLQNGKNLFKIDMNLNNGLYILKLTTQDNETLSAKFVK